MSNITGYILIENNTFDNNIGLHGGAIHIDQQSRVIPTVDDYSSLIYLSNNSFTRNMAYFSGNAVFIRGG